MAISKKWFDDWEAILQSEAKLAGLFEHGTLTGAAREFLVKRVLKSLLPTEVHVGTGRIVDAFDKLSRQIDLILYDPRFPFLEIHPGSGLYFADGVIATVEVKSTILTTNDLEIALDNCRSVFELSYAHDEKEIQRILSDKSGSPVYDLERRKLLQQIRPPSYLFAFRLELSLERFAEAFHNWFRARGTTDDPITPALPAVIAVPGALGILNHRYVRIDSRQTEAAGHLVFALCKTSKRFGWFAMDVLQTVQYRLRPTHGHAGIYRPIEVYLPWSEYWKEIQEADLTVAELRDTRPLLE